MKKEDISAARRHELLPWLISNSFCDPGFLVLTSAGVWGEYPDHLTLTLFISRDQMGFSNTTAAATVTVATSDMLWFCKMKFLQMSIHQSPCKQYLCRKTTFIFIYFCYPHWAQRISTRCGFSAKWETYPNGLNITSQKERGGARGAGGFHLLWNSLCFLYSALKISTSLRSWNLNYGLVFWDVVQYIQKAGKWFWAEFCQLCSSVDNMRQSPPFSCLLVLFPDCTRMRF